MNKSAFKTEFLFYAAFLLTGIFVLLQSPLAPYAKSINGVDSSAFIYSAQRILDGQTMYKDIVDHKGPFLYVIDAAALFIFNGKFIGIWIFEIISLFIASIMMYKTARLLAGKIFSFLAVITAILFLVPLLVGGNITEEWALPFISIATYIFVAYLKDNKPLGIVSLLILSLTFVLTFMIRPNMAAVWAGFGIVLLVKWIVEKKYKELIRNLSFLSLFALLFMLPFFLYFYFKGALSDAIYLIFKYNAVEYNPRSLIFILKACPKILGGVYEFSAIPFIIMIYMFFRDKSIISISVISAFIITALTCGIGGRFPHYYLIFAPLIVIPYSYILEIITKNIPKAKYICLFIIFIFFNLKPVNDQSYYKIPINYSGTDYVIETVPPPVMAKLKEIIIQNTKPTDKILVRGYQSSVYLYSGRACATRFPYTLNRSSLAIKYYVKEAEEALPKMIIQGEVVNNLMSPDFMLDSLLNKKYILIPTDIKDLEIWKLKDDR